jgi:hypothetical protein
LAGGLGAGSRGGGWRHELRAEREKGHGNGKGDARREETRGGNNQA